MEIQREIKSVLFQNIFIPVALTILSVAALGLVFYEASSANFWVLHTDDVIRNLTSLQKNVSDAQAGARGYLLTGKDNFLEPFRDAEKQYAQQSDELTRLVVDNSDQAEKARLTTQLINEWFIYTESVLSLPLSEAVKKMQTGVGEGKVVIIRNKLQEMLDEERRLKTLRANKQSQIYYLAAWILIPLLLIGNGVITYRGRRSVLTIANAYQKRLAENQQQYAILEHENWVREAEAALSSALLKAETIESMGFETLKFLVQRLDAIAGTIFIKSKNDTKTYARRASLGMKSEIEHVIMIEPLETVHSKAVLTKKVQILENVENSEWKIQSGLGNHNPSFLLVAPILFLGRSIGFLELAFLKKPLNNSLEFLEQSAERLGGLFSNELSKENLAELYSDLKKKSEELTAQQEELKVSNEELEHRATLLNDSQAKLEESNAELEEANELLQQQTKNLEEQKERLDQRNQELLNARSALEQQTQDLTKASHHKSQFLANMSHELRTPLNSSMILAQLLIENREGNLTPKQVDQVSQILRSGQDLLALINDILDLSKVEAGKVELEISEFDSHHVAEWARATFEPLCQKKKIQFSIQERTQNSILKTDRMRLQQILGNLLSNATKFTEQGRVSLEIESLEKAGQNYVHFKVTDTGVGIPRDKIDLIFEPFKQADGSVTRKFGGTGLGLAISKHLVGLLGGTISASSTLGQGSSFSLTIQSEIAAQGPTAPDQIRSHWTSETSPQSIADDRNSRNSRSTVLVIEDDPTFASILRDQVRQKGFNCLVAPTAREGQELALTKNPAAIILDINLPDYSGLIVLEQLKNHPTTRLIPVHIVSVLDEANRALKLGASQFLTKPLSLPQILDLIEALSSDQKPKNVLVIEDDRNQVEAIRKMIQSDQVTIATALTGQEALRQLRSDQIFDCIILDLKLPDISGFEVLRTMEKEKKSSPWPPVIVHTAIDISPSEERELRAFANSLILKGAHSMDRLADEVSLFVHQSMPKRLNPSPVSSNVSRRETLSGQRILLVDDDLRNVFALTSALEAADAKVTMAANGREAIEVIKKEEPFDLILMDVMMPVMGGLEAIGLIRHELNMREIPIIALTAKAMKDDREICMKAGANDYLAKPLDIQKLFSLIKIWTNRVV